MARKSKLDRPLLGSGPLVVQQQLPGRIGFQTVGFILPERGIRIDFAKEASEWEAMAEAGSQKLKELIAASSDTRHDQFNIDHTRLYIEVCRRFAREPDLGNLEAWQAVADQFITDGAKLAERHGIKL